jgi:hypothetical protein
VSNLSVHRKVLALLRGTLLGTAFLASSASAATPPWETWPSGRTFGSEVARPEPPASARVCSFELPVCVHAPDEGSLPTAMTTLAEAESAIRFLSLQARLPWPHSDVPLGGTGAFDLYLVRGQRAGYRTGFEMPSSAPVDRASSFGLLRAELPPGCVRRTAIHRLVAISMLAEIDAGADAGSFAATASYLAALGTGCLGPLLDAVDASQTHPERAAMFAEHVDDPDVSPLLPWYLDEGFGGGAPGSLVTALWYGGRQSTPRDASRFHDQPDLFDVVTRVAKSKQKKLDDVLVDFAIARAFLGDRDDGLHLPETRPFGPFGRVRFDASWQHSTLPRRLAFTPLEPTGATFLWIDLAGAPPTLELDVHIEWEEPVTMHFALIRVGHDGQEVSRIDLSRERGVRVLERRMLELADLAGVMIIGVNAGEIGPDHPFRANEAPYEPHGGTIYVVKGD